MIGSPLATATLPPLCALTMSKVALDDLYGDIYGDDDLEPSTGEIQGLTSSSSNVPSTAPASAPTSLVRHDLPPKPSAVQSSPPSSSSMQPSNSANNISYSAQIAQQFASYQQTPSQERQQRPESVAIPHSMPARTQQTSAIPTHGATTYEAGDTVFGKKPSEMHDHGQRLYVTLILAVFSLLSFQHDTDTRINFPCAYPCFATSDLPLLCSATIYTFNSKMFVGGLNWDTTDEGLRDYFAQFGKVRDSCLAPAASSDSTTRKVDAVTIMRDPSGTSRGFAFMTFEDGEVVPTVLGRDHVLDGKSIDPKRAIPREEHIRNTRYFVGGLSPNTTSESMKDFFGAYGKVVDATVMVDRDTGRSKGFGFVTFEDATNSDQLVGKIGLVLDEKEIEVKAAQPRSQRDQVRQQQQTTNASFNDTNSRTPSINPQQQMSMMMQRQMPMMANATGMNSMGMGMGMGMGMNPMMGMGMGMNPMAMMGMGMNPMMGMGMGGMNGMMGGGMGMGAMRMGMGPMTGMGMRSMMGPGVGRMAAMNANAQGAARNNMRGQHNFHPYSRPS
ncbi:unnamed protein product [Mycena citricolor]|uniref:RRM domain-containing protein n=1 Tax=Mycena citricolor TaxID=2018698 RepID=A0AAD2JUI0_9AGAR|nr:unnamed protein product [Mycena citricolor]